MVDLDRDKTKETRASLLFRLDPPLPLLSLPPSHRLPLLGDVPRVCRRKDTPSPSSQPRRRLSRPRRQRPISPVSQNPQPLRPPRPPFCFPTLLGSFPPFCSHPPTLRALETPLPPPSTSNLVAARVSQPVFSRQAPEERQRAASKPAPYLYQPLLLFAVFLRRRRTVCLARSRPQRSPGHQRASPDPRNPCPSPSTRCSPEGRWQWEETARGSPSSEELALSRALGRGRRWLVELPEAGFEGSCRYRAAWNISSSTREPHRYRAAEAGV